MKGLRLSLQALVLVFLFPSAVPAQVGLCISPTLRCAEFLPIRTTWRVLVFRSQPLTVRNSDINHIVVIIHGAERDAATSFRIGSAAGVLASRIENTLIVAPRFAARVGTACTDDIAADEFNWQCDVTLGDWRSGGDALSGGTMSSFEVLDEILKKLEDPQLFPNLRSVVVAGHSAGGQFVTNYQMTNRVHDQLRIAPKYVAANASVYAYPDTQRPFPVDATTCPAYANWPFGISARAGYVAQATPDELLEQTIKRPVTFLVGESDTQPLDGGFFGSCAALAQGATRRERGEAFGTHMSDRHNAQQASIVVPRCPHSEVCMFTSRPGIEALFPKEF